MNLHYGPENLQALLGIAVILGLCWGLSENRGRFPFGLAARAAAV